MAKKILLIVNPFSGRGISKPSLGIIVSLLCGSGNIVTVAFSEEGDPEGLAFEYGNQHDMLICVGGDGTLSAVVSGLLLAEASVPVGYIPAGTVNDFARSLALPKNPGEAVKAILEGHPKPLDIGSFQGRYFTYIAAFGIFTGAAYRTSQSAKRALGHLAYVIGGLADMPAVKPQRMKIEYDGKFIEDEFVFGAVMNSTSVAGLIKIDPVLVDLSDGMFEVVLVKQPLNLTEFLDILTHIATNNYTGDNLQMLHASKMKFTFEDEVAWTVDGEFGGAHKEVEITNCREAISILVN